MNQITNSTISRFRTRQKEAPENHPAPSPSREGQDRRSGHPRLLRHRPSGQEGYPGVHHLDRHLRLHRSQGPVGPQTRSSRYHWLQRRSRLGCSRSRQWLVGRWFRLGRRSRRLLGFEPGLLRISSQIGREICLMDDWDLSDLALESFCIRVIYLVRDDR